MYSNLDIIILCGGLGKRFRGVDDKIPKSLGHVSGKPIIRWLIDDIKEMGFKRIILATGYMGDQIEKYISEIDNVEIIISREDFPLGTGGAIKNAESQINSDTFFVLNGDTRVQINLGHLYNSYIENSADMSILLSSATNGEDYGRVEINDKNILTGFLEKEKMEEVNYVNSGVYCIGKSLLLNMDKDKNYSLENELIPEWIKLGKVYGYVINKPFIDIGTPERFKKAKFE